MAKAARQNPLHLEWIEFARRNAGNPFLEHDPLYSLNEPLIECIKGELPDFFSAEQEGFERDLINSASFGFFNRQAIGITAKERVPDPQTGLSAQDHLESKLQSFKESTAGMLSHDGLNDAEIVAHFQQQTGIQDTIDTRKHAYAGWLICNRVFRDEVAEFRVAWGKTVAKVGRFPAYPRFPYSMDSVTDRNKEFREACFRFYLRWGLDRLLTWDWPVPMEPDFAVGLFENIDVLSGAGVMVFVPWYLIRGEKLDLQLAIQLASTNFNGEHLREWLGRHAGNRSDEKGEISFARILWIYRYHELVLKRRFGQTLQKNIQRLDRAFAAFIRRDEDTVKKLRLTLNRQLRPS
jgi:hypothetical protein